MGVLNLAITTGKTDATLVQEFERSTSTKYATVQSMADFLQSILSGTQVSPSIVSSVIGNTVAATSTFTLTSVIATDACSINGVTFTCVASGATGNQFNVGADDAATAANLAAAINASATALVNTQVTAAVTSTIATPAVVTVTAVTPGYAGNAITIATADSTIVVPGARLTGGVPDPSRKTYSF